MWSDLPCVKTSALGDACGYLSYMERKFPLSRGEVGGSCYLINTSHIRNPQDFDVIADFVFKANAL